MAKLWEVLTTELDDETHIPADDVTGMQTACGAVDVSYQTLSADDNQVTCKDCLSVLRYYKNLKLPK